MLKRLKAIFFLLTFAASVVGYTLELHYCQGKVTDISLIGDAQCVCSVHEEKVEESCAHRCHPTEEKEEKSDVSNHCCKTEKLTFLSTSLKAHSQHTVFDQLFFPEISVPAVPYFTTVTEKTVFVAYTPPVLTRDITVLHRSFLI